MKDLVEFVNRDTGEPITIPASQVRCIKSRDEFNGDQITSVLYAGKEVDITDNYDSFCAEMKRAGYRIRLSVEYTPDK